MEGETNIYYFYFQKESFANPTTTMQIVIM
jgi:hypothetical protein